MDRIDPKSQSPLKLKADQDREAKDRLIFLYPGPPAELMDRLQAGIRANHSESPPANLLEGLTIHWSEPLKMTVVGTREAMHRLAMGQFDRVDIHTLKRDDATWTNVARFLPCSADQILNEP